jgi:predicted RNA-binding Zn-ribbon protein involved in translation (DUF1610 family)
VSADSNAIGAATLNRPLIQGQSVMSNITDKLTHTFACPHCGHDITYKLAGLKADPLLTCGACGKKTQIESGGTLSKASNELAKLDRAWDDLLSGFNKR